MEFWKGLITDAKNRVEPKLIIAYPLIVVGLVYLFLKNDVGGFLAIEGFAASLLFGTALADHKLDSTSK
jgi:hypothetical protein